MAQNQANLSGYKGVWLLAMFDLPVDTPAARKAYTQFRKVLLRYGFSMLQFSVYARYFASEDASRSYRGIVRPHCPAKGR